MVQFMSISPLFGNIVYTYTHFTIGKHDVIDVRGESSVLVYT